MLGRLLPPTAESSEGAPVAILPLCSAEKGELLLITIESLFLFIKDSFLDPKHFVGILLTFRASSSRLKEMCSLEDAISYLFGIPSV